MTEKTPFDLFAFMDARSFPTEDVRVYTNEQLASEALPLLDERTELLDKRKKEVEYNETQADTKDIDARVKKIDAELKKIEADAKKSSLVFHLRGVPQNVIDAAFKTDDDKGHNRVLAAMLTGVTGPDGTDSAENYSPEDIEKLYGVLPPQGAHTLTTAVSRLLVASLAFDGMADAGFLAKS